MGEIYIQKYTTHNPITLIGYEAGICWGANINDDTKNYKRGLGCIKSNHGRTLEFPQVYITFEGYSARTVRQFYTAIGGAPTRLQASTRYINYEDGFVYIEPKSIQNNQEASDIYRNTIEDIYDGLKSLDNLRLPREDIATLLPLSMESTFVCRTNLRHLIDMSHQRLCSRAYWEYRDLMRDLMNALRNYDDEWKYVVDKYFIPKCEVCGFCIESKSCGRMPKENDYDARIKNLQRLKEESNKE